MSPAKNHYRAIWWFVHWYSEKWPGQVDSFILAATNVTDRSSIGQGTNSIITIRSMAQDNDEIKQKCISIFLKGGTIIGKMLMHL